MTVAAAELTPLRISTDALPERDRLAYWREEVGRGLFQSEISPLGEAPFYARTVLNTLPGARIATFTTSAVRYERTRSIVMHGGGDHLGVTVNLGSPALVAQSGREVVLAPGDATVASHREPSTFIVAGGSYIGLSLPVDGLRPLIGDVEQAAPLLISRSSTALRLLISYLAAISSELTTGEAELQLRIVAHINDLVAMAIGATRDGAVLALGRGVRAARLHAVKADILDSLGNPDLSVGAVAQRQGMTPRHVHRLFEIEGTTFSQFVLGARLARTYHRLADRRHEHQTITAIACAAGFGDLSYFNRSFRRCYGASPSEVRAESVLHQSSQRLSGLE